MFGGRKSTKPRKLRTTTGPLYMANRINSFWTPTETADTTAAGPSSAPGSPASGERAGVTAAPTTPAGSASTSGSQVPKRRLASNTLLSALGKQSSSTSRKRGRSSSPEPSGSEFGGSEFGGSDIDGHGPRQSRSSLALSGRSSPAASDADAASTSSWTKQVRTSMHVSATRAKAAVKRNLVAVIRRVSPSSSRNSSPAPPESTRPSSRASSEAFPPRSRSPSAYESGDDATRGDSYANAAPSLGASTLADIPLDDGDPNFVDVDEDLPGGAQTDPTDAAQGSRGPQTKRARAKAYRDPILHFAVPHNQDVLLRELTRHEGLKDLKLKDNGYPLCARCGQADGEICCRSCRKRGLFCKACACKDHAAHPLHRIRIWNGQFMAPYSLQRAGLVIDLGHDGEPCPHRKQPTDITVIHTNGIHRVTYRECECMIIGGSTIHVQLMRAGWMPASMLFPRVAVTLEALEAFHALSFQGKVNAYDYYNGLVRLSDGGGIIKIKTCYKAWLRCTRMFRHLRRCKRAGRAQDPLGVANTKPGELVIECPACPMEKNLPKGWEDAPEGMRYLYALLLAIDANFKLKLKDKKATNVPLSDGMGFFPPDKEYKEHLDTHGVKQLEQRHCTSEHNALRHANLTSKRWIVNGVGACICARHLLYRKHGVVDIPGGEKFACMDHCVFATLGITAKIIKRLVLSYDIVCSWSVNFFERLENIYGDLYKLPDDAEVVFVIPKFHIEAHGDDCKCAFNLNFTLGAARTCGEGVEAGWADMNLIGVFTREMSPAHRHEVIEDFMQAINFRKIKTMATSFAKQLEEAVKLKEKQTIAFTKHEGTLDPAVVKRWMEDIKAWDVLAFKKGGDSPYREPVSSQSLKEIKDKLALEEEAELNKAVPLNAMTASTYISAVIALEDQKYTVAKIAKKRHLSMQDETSSEIREAQLFQRMQTLESVQHSYVVGINEDFRQRLADEVDAEIARAASRADQLKEKGHTGPLPHDALPPPPYPAPLESLPRATSKRSGARAKHATALSSRLWLPSNLPPELRRRVLLSDLVNKEIRLRIAICMDALYNLKRALRTRHAAFLQNTKGGRAHVSQKNSTRQQTSRSSLASAIKRHGDRYRRSYAALVALDPRGLFEGGKWKQILRPLAVTDQTTPQEDEGEHQDDEETEATAGTSAGVPPAPRGQGRGGKKSEGRKELSWIWQVGRFDAQYKSAETDEGAKAEMEKYERVDWARLRARSLRWTEQVELLCEEMRRVVTTHMKTADEWVQRAEIAANDPKLARSEDIKHGLVAHAYRQANVYKTLANGCIDKWVPLIRKHGLKVDWPASLAVRVEVAAQAALAPPQLPKGKQKETVETPHETGSAKELEEEEEEDSDDSEDEALAAIDEELADDPTDDFAAVTDIESDIE